MSITGIGCSEGKSAKSDGRRTVDPMWRVGRFLAMLGGIWGTLMGLGVGASVLSHRLTSQMPPSIAIAIWESEIFSTALVVVPFAFLFSITWLSIRNETMMRFVGPLDLMLGILLTILSLLTGFSVGPLIIIGALLVLLGGLLLTLVPPKSDAPAL